MVKKILHNFVSKTRKKEKKKIELSKQSWIVKSCKHLIKIYSKRNEGQVLEPENAFSSTEGDISPRDTMQKLRGRIVVA